MDNYLNTPVTALEEEEEVGATVHAQGQQQQQQLPLLNSDDVDLLLDLIQMTTTMPLDGIPAGACDNDDDSFFRQRNSAYLPSNLSTVATGAIIQVQSVPEPVPSTSNNVPPPPQQQYQQQLPNLDDDDEQDEVNVDDDTDDEDELDTLLLEQLEVKKDYNREWVRLKVKFDKEVLDLKKKETKTHAKISEKLTTAMGYKIKQGGDIVDKMVTLSQADCKNFEAMFAMISDLKAMRDEVFKNKKITVIRTMSVKIFGKAIVSNLLAFFHFQNVTEIAKLYEQTKGWSENGKNNFTFVDYKWNLRKDCEEWMRQARNHPKATEFVYTHLMNVISTWPKIPPPKHRKRKHV